MRANILANGDEHMHQLSYKQYVSKYEGILSPYQNSPEHTLVSMVTVFRRPINLQKAADDFSVFYESVMTAASKWPGMDPDSENWECYAWMDLGDRTHREHRDWGVQNRQHIHSIWVLPAEQALRFKSQRFIHFWGPIPKPIQRGRCFLRETQVRDLHKTIFHCTGSVKHLPERVEIYEPGFPLVLPEVELGWVRAA
jgi:hypothetical protein